MPTFYQHGAVMLTPESIQAKQDIAAGKKVEQNTNKEIIDTIVDVKSTMGIHTTEAEKKRLESMRKDQLEELRDTLAKERAEMLNPKKASRKKKTTEKS